MDLSHILTVVVSLTGLSVVLSAVGCVIAFRQSGGGGFRAFCAYCLPRDLITCRSCWQDVGFVLVKQLVRPWTTGVVLLFTSANCALAVYGALVFSFGPRPQGAMTPLLFGTLLLAAVLMQDFLRFGAHYFMHRIGVLWDAHKVHHSASFLTPLTNHRAHIIEEVIQQAAIGLSIGPLLGVAAFVTSTSIATTELLGFDAYALIDTLSFALLRHSHIGLSFGRLERYVMSPKQHHLHHSVDPRHWGKNFGFLFACWDRMAGTICYSSPREKISVGIASGELADYDSVIKLHLMPYLKLYRRLSLWWSERTRAVASASPPKLPDGIAPLRSRESP
jgi:sterol desaturase/sphingolipid hydroxylase (fatty acid hydroxylase superfamily)